ncbi:hypothetical protein FOA52_007143 [Chlamydomonas sp. UWO 241]|nr:hypothetical protein FOA52_007143 [Chlamydomonas sp. UWO 241]
MAAPGVAKAVEKVRRVMDTGSHYEAQQMVKTIYHRHKARRQLEESYAVLREGAVLQLQASQITCGVELGLLLTEAVTLDQPPAEEALPSLLAILRALPLSLPPSTSAAAEDALIAEEGRLVAAAVKWANKAAGADAAAQLHDAFASHLFSACGWRRMGSASMHFARGRDACAFAGAVASCSEQAPPEEADLFVARATLQTLATAATPSSTKRQLAHAQALFSALSERLPSTTASPLSHFTRFLMAALDKRSWQLAALLRQHYGPSLARDPVLGAYVAQIEKVYLGVGGGGGGGGLGGLLGGLLQSLTEMDEFQDAEGADSDDESLGRIDD